MDGTGRLEASATFAWLMIKRVLVAAGFAAARLNVLGLPGAS